MSQLRPFVVPLKPHVADESKKISILSRSKDKRLPALPPPTSPRSLGPLQPGATERALSRSGTVPSPPRGSSITRTSSSTQHPIYSIKLMPPQSSHHHHPSAAPPQPKYTERRIIRRQLAGVLSDSVPQQRSPYRDPDPASRRPEPTIRTTEPLRDAEEERPSAAAAGDSEDDEATLVSSSDAHLCQDSRDAKEKLFKDSQPNPPISIIHRRILDHIPGFSDDESDDVTRVAVSSPRRLSPRARTPTPPSRCWGVRGTTHIEFEVVQEERTIPANTALRPPPWHQQGGEKYVAGMRPSR